MANDKPAAPAKQPADPAQVKLAREIARQVWAREFRATNPEGTPAQKKEAWAATKGDYIKVGRKIANSLKKAGFTITAA